MDLAALCEEFGYNYTKSLKYAIENWCKGDQFPGRSDCSKIKNQIRNIVNEKTPYTFYGPDPIELSYETLKSLVLGSNLERTSYPTKGYDVAMYLSYEEVHLTLKPHLDELKRRIHGLKKKHHATIDMKMAATFYDCDIKLRQNNIILFGRDECQCDICGLKARYVTLDKTKDNSKLSIWAIDKNNKPVRMTVDHKKARGLGGSGSFNNLVPMCEPCNSIKSVIESKIANHNNDLGKLKDAKIYPFECSFYW